MIMRQSEMKGNKLGGNWYLGAKQDIWKIPTQLVIWGKEDWGTGLSANGKNQYLN